MDAAARAVGVLAHPVGTSAPAVDELFGKINRADGQTVVISVSLFVERVGAMDRGEEPFGAKGPEAREYLRTRGLTDAIIAEAQRHLDAVLDLRVEAVPQPELNQAEATAAEEAMWKWYLEWSTIVRTVIKDGNLLRSLGFKKRRGRNSSNDEFEVVETDDPGEVVVLPAPEVRVLAGK